MNDLIVNVSLSDIVTYTVINDAPFAGIQSVKQSISVVNFTSSRSKHAYYMQHKTIKTD